MNIINVFMCLRNNEDTIINTFKLLNDIEVLHNEYKFRYYIYENDSTDTTKSIIIDFFKNHSGTCIFETLNKKQWGNTRDIDRVFDMSIYRNKMKSLCKNFKNSEFSIILDSNITFKNNILQQMIEILKDNDTIHMVTPFGFVKYRPKLYYDTFALDLDSSIKGTNLQKIKHEIKSNNLIELKSGFAGFVLIRTKTLQKCSWKCNSVGSEHNEFCKEVSKYGKIICASHIKVCWKK